MWYLYYQQSNTHKDQISVWKQYSRPKGVNDNGPNKTLFWLTLLKNHVCTLCKYSRQLSKHRYYKSKTIVEKKTKNTFFDT